MLRQVLTKSPGDVVVLSAARTAVCRARRGHFKDAYPEELLAAVLAAVPNKDAIEDVAVGVVLSELGGSKAARAALNHVGFDAQKTTLNTVNRACASSLQAVADIANRIRAGDISVGIAAGMESMTRNYGSRAIPQDLWPTLSTSGVKDARDCVLSMGTTSENVAQRYGVSRHDQDTLSLASHRRSARTMARGGFAREIVPVTTLYLPPLPSDAPADTASRLYDTITVDRDDGVRHGLTIDALAKLKPAFAADGTTTAGNASQVSDGAAALVLARRDAVADMKPLGRFVGSVVVGCHPDEMGIGPALAIPALLRRYGLQTDDVHRWEINEAFASQALYCVRALGLESAWAASDHDYMDSAQARPRALVNPDGGAIALGHPLGATGARLATTLLHGLARDGGEVGVVSMCIGTGMGMAALFVRE